MKKYLTGAIFLILLCFICGKTEAFSPNVPLNTLKIAEEAETKEGSVKSFQSEIVRIGIGNQSFGSYVYKTAGLYATAPLTVYQDGLKIKQLPANYNVNVSINPDFSYTLTDDTGREILNLNGIIKFTTTDGLIGVKNLKRAGKPALYRGYFEIIKAPSGVQFNLVNKIPVEEYLQGVVPNEMPIRFGLEALKAQSIAARNYVLSPRTKASPNYDAVDSVASQVYFGANTEQDLSNRAVKETEGLVALYDWDLILALYSSTAGGYTESYSHAFSDPKSGAFPSAEKPYLKAKPDILTQESLKSEEAASAYYKSKPEAYDIRSPYYRWTRNWSSDELRAVLQTTLASQSGSGFVKPAFHSGDILGELKEIKVKKRGDSGKIVEIEIITDDKNYKIYKELIIRRLFTKDGKALPSANVVFENARDDEGNLISVEAFGGGFGHGVGMSQFGAGFMGSELNLPYEKILQHYYSGITIGTKPVIVSYDDSQNSVVQTFWAKNKKAVIVIDNKFQMHKIDVNINGIDYVFGLPSGFPGGNRCVKIDISNYVNIGKNKIIFSYPADEGGKKAVRLFVELVEKDVKDNIWE